MIHAETQNRNDSARDRRHPWRPRWPPGMAAVPAAKLMPESLQSAAAAQPSSATKPVRPFSGAPHFPATLQQ